MLLRINLLLLLVVAVLPFPTRLVAESLDDVEGERVFIALYGVVLLAIRLLLTALDAYARREQLYADGDDAAPAKHENLAVVVAFYALAILISLLLPALAVGLYCAIAIVLVVPLSEIRRLLSRRARS